MTCSSRAVTRRRKAASAAGPSRDSIIQAASGTTGAGTTSSPAWSERTRPRSSCLVAGFTGIGSGHEDARIHDDRQRRGSDTVGEPALSERSSHFVDVERPAVAGCPEADEGLKRLVAGQLSPDCFNHDLISADSAICRDGLHTCRDLVRQLDSKGHGVSLRLGYR